MLFGFLTVEKDDVLVVSFTVLGEAPVIDTDMGYVVLQHTKRVLRVDFGAGNDFWLLPLSQPVIVVFVGEEQVF